MEGVSFAFQAPQPFGLSGCGLLFWSGDLPTTPTVRCKMAPICTSGPSKQGDEVQNGPVLHLRAGNLRGSGAKNRVFAPLRAEGPDSGIIVLIQERHAVVGLHRMIEVHCDNGIFLAVQRFHD